MPSPKSPGPDDMGAQQEARLQQQLLLSEQIRCLVWRTHPHCAFCSISSQSSQPDVVVFMSGLMSGKELKRSEGLAAMQPAMHSCPLLSVGSRMLFSW